MTALHNPSNPHISGASGATSASGASSASSSSPAEASGPRPPGPSNSKNSNPLVYKFSQSPLRPTPVANDPTTEKMAQYLSGSFTEPDRVREAPLCRKMEGLGRIYSMTLPPGWVETSQKDGGSRLFSGMIQYREFQPPASPETFLAYWNRGFLGNALTPRTGKAFIKVLSEAPHTLSTKEVEGLSELLGKAGNTQRFSILDVRTMQLNGNRVLVVDGTWTDNRDRAAIVMFPSDSTGTLVEQICYEASAEDYSRYLDFASNALLSIKWRYSNSVNLEQPQSST